MLDGRYEIERLLGRGGMADVYLARQLRVGRRCALKVIRPERLADPDARARFEREAALSARLSHPNLCHIYDYGVTTDGLPFLAMEWLQGETLASVLARGPLPPDRAARIASGCAAALAAAHEAGIVHRDLKPANLMLVRRGDQEVPVVMDFGIAQGADHPGVTRGDLLVGTPEVMSPEQIAGDPVSAASDQYQLGLLVVRMLTGTLPFDGSSSQETMVARLTTAPKTLAELCPTLGAPPAVQAVLDRALARRPGDRWPSVAAFGAALQAALTGESEGATIALDRPRDSPIDAAASQRDTARGTDRRSGWWVALAAMVLVLAVLAVRPRPGEIPGASPEQPGGDLAPPPPATVPPETVSPTRAPPGAAAAPAPPLPHEDEVFSDDPAVRRRAREAAERVFGTATVPDSTRALAAFFVAEVFRAERLPASARTWLEQCLALQERPLCRRLLNSLP